MQLSNARYTTPEHIYFDVDVTINDETFPFSYHPLDNAPTRLAIAAYIAENGLEIAEYVAPTPTINDFSRAIETHIDQIAQTRGYSSAVSCASYVASTNPLWQAEAQAFVTGRDAMWDYAFAELDKVQNGQRLTPTVEEFLAELPTVSWPS